MKETIAEEIIEHLNYMAAHSEDDKTQNLLDAAASMLSAQQRTLQTWEHEMEGIIQGLSLVGPYIVLMQKKTEVADKAISGIKNLVETSGPIIRTCDDIDAVRAMSGVVETLKASISDYSDLVDEEVAYREKAIEKVDELANKFGLF